MTSLAEELSKLLDPVGDSLDPEDDALDETSAKLIDVNDLEHHSIDCNNTIKRNGYSRIRTLDKAGKKYHGKTISRKSLISDSKSDNDGSVGSLSPDAMDIEAHNTDGRDSHDSSELDDSNESEPNDGMSDVDLMDEDGMDEEIDSDEADGNSLEIFKAPVQASHGQKKKATRNQLRLWEKMLESRIKCQEILSLCNRMPQANTFHLFSDQVHSSLVATDKVIESVLLKLLELQRRLLEQNSLTKMIADSQSGSRKRKGSPLEELDADAQHKSIALAGVRNKILKLWYDKTRLTTNDRSSSKSFESFERTPVTQIADVLSDKARLLKRTQSKRSQYRTLGKEICTPAQDQGNEKPIGHASSLELDSEIYDDDDFYHQLIRQLIEQKSLGSLASSDSLELSRLNLKVQSLRSKARKSVDTKASKGRKVRYGIHSKLQSFMAPNDQSSFSHESRNQIFKSVFGGFGVNSSDVPDQ